MTTGVSIGSFASRHSSWWPDRLSGCSYNRFTAAEEAIKAQWGQVENQLMRRNDLIPNLVESVKGFAQQERDVIQSVTDARAKMAGRDHARRTYCGRERRIQRVGSSARRRRELPAAQVGRDVRAPDG